MTPRPGEGSGLQDSRAVGLSSKSKVLTTFRGGLGAWQGAPLHPFSSTVTRFTPRFQAAARTGLRTAALGGQGQKQAVLGGMAAQRHIGGPLIASVFRQGAPATRSELSRLLCEGCCDPDDWSSPHGLLPQLTGGNRVAHGQFVPAAHLEDVA